MYFKHFTCSPLTSYMTLQLETGKRNVRRILEYWSSFNWSPHFLSSRHFLNNHSVSFSFCKAFPAKPQIHSKKCLIFHTFTVKITVRTYTTVTLAHMRSQNRILLTALNGLSLKSCADTALLQCLVGDTHKREIQPHFFFH